MGQLNAIKELGVQNCKFALKIECLSYYDFSMNISFYTRVSSYVDWVENAKRSMAIHTKAVNLVLLLTAILTIFLNIEMSREFL